MGHTGTSGTVFGGAPSAAPKSPLAFGSSFSWPALLDFSEYTADVSRHLARVYGALALACGAAVVGVALSVLVNVPSLLGILAALVLAPTIILSRDSLAPRTRLLLLCGLGAAQGTLLGPLINQILDLDGGHRLVLRAFVGTLLVFGCLSGSALYARRRSFFWLAGLLSTAVLSLATLALINLVLRSSFAFTLHLYGGLMVFCLYVLVDTQMIIERFHAGDQDAIAHSVDLFIDVIAIFVRLLVILAKNAKKKD